MNTILMESLYELNDIIAECNSAIIYESIMIESEDNVIDVEYRKSDEKYKKKNKFLEKVKVAWKKFVEAMKKVVKASIEFIKKNVKLIRDTMGLSVLVEDRRDLLDGLKQLNVDTKSGVAFKKLANRQPNEDNPYTEKYVNNGVKLLRMKKGDAIKFLEKQLNEANKLMDDFDKLVDELLQFYDDNKSNMGRFEAIENKRKVEFVNIARESIRKYINAIARDLQDLTTKKRDMKE